MTDHVPRIAIIGGGFSGTLLLANLLRQTAAPLHISLFDAHGAFARGVAYATTSPQHLLNVPAIKMGGFAEEPYGFYEWLHEHDASWRSLHPAYSRLTVCENTFMPRQVYGAYLQHILRTALQQAAIKDCTINQHCCRITACLPVKEGGWQLVLDSGERHRFDRVVLATGTENAPAPLSAAHNFWSPAFQQRLKALPVHTWPDDTVVAILGTGLSMTDAVLSLQDKGYKGRIVCLSRHGLLPAVHRQERPCQLNSLIDLSTVPATASGLYRYWMRAGVLARRQGSGWQSVLAALRPVTNALWQRMPLQEQQSFMKDYYTKWNVLRHRLPPESYAMLAQLRQQKRLSVIAGQVLEAQDRVDGVCLRYQPLGKPSPVTLSARLLIDTSGYTRLLSETRSPLLRSLLGSGMVRPHPLGYGLATDGNHQVAPHLYAMGFLLFGERMETSAVPELRQQAAAIAARLASSITSTLPGNALFTITRAGSPTLHWQ